MPYSIKLMHKLDAVSPDIKDVLYTILDEIEQQREQSVNRTDFHELQEIVFDLGNSTRELADAQKRTEVKVGELADAQKRTEVKVGELADAQKRTEAKVEELADAQKRTEIKVEELADAQKRTEIRMEELADAQKRTEIRMEELADAQKRTEIKVEELADAQKRTEIRMEELADAQAEMVVSQKAMSEEIRVMSGEIRVLARSLESTRSQVGGLARSVAYALENEAYRNLPEYLKRQYQLEMQERFVRKEVAGEEINIFGHALRNGEQVLIVGEAVLKFDDGAKMKQLEDNLASVRQEFSLPIIPLLVTHYAVPTLLKKAQEKGVIVVQSFEWD